MSWIKLILIVTALVLANAPSLSGQDKKEKPSRKKAKADLSEQLFATNAPIRTFRIEISSNELAALKRDARAYARGAISEGSNVLRDVGVHLKGNGSFQGLDQKPSFAVKFDRFVDDRELFGLNKIMLNNSVQDGTFLAEMMATWMFRDANVPSPRVTHSRVTFNGRDLGMYVCIEAENKNFLKRWFKNGTGSLYENYLKDVDAEMDQDNGDDLSQADVKNLAGVTKLPDPAERWTKLQTVLDVDRYVSHLVCEIFTSHTDGYAMNRNNYRIYYNPDDGRFTFIGHGMDWGFANTGVSKNPPMNSLVTKAALTTPQGSALFKERRGTLFTNVFRLDVMTNRVNTAVARLLAQARNQNETNDYRRWGMEMNNRIVTRWQNLTNQFAAPEPVPLAFDGNGVASLKSWQKKLDTGTPVQDEATSDGKKVLRISSTNAACIASWRTRVLLAPGKYRFEGDLRGTRIEPLPNEIGIGAGLRISGDKRQNKLVGDAAWTHLQYDFNIEGAEREVELVCELRANKGEVLFDAASLYLIRQR
ncbi:MAG TPA: CotH kinase family protein [Candidatus Acidoferrum sp.]|nr:CotH kinase family protein [Candidatus Acidoferrum sp.]